MDINDLYNQYDEFVKSNIEDARHIALYYENGTLGSFSTGLMDLIGKADENNRKRIKLAFPEYIHAYYIWFNGDYKNKGGIVPK